MYTKVWPSGESLTTCVVFLCVKLASPGLDKIKVLVSTNVVGRLLFTTTTEIRRYEGGIHKNIKALKFPLNTMRFRVPFLPLIVMFTYLLTYLLTPWSRVLLEKLTSELCS
jgi:hypothetical protein